MTDSIDPRAHDVLRIVDGLHAGASRVLGRDEMILVGSGDDCDIVLADDGVANHHALVTLVGGRYLVRALDGPVRIGEETILPGDPVELSAVQQVRIGAAAIAFGPEDDPAWDNFLTVFAPEGEDEPRRPAIARRLPLIAGVAVLSLASLAIFAAVLPAPQQGGDARERLTALMSEHQVANFEIVDGVDGRPTVTGAIDSRAELDRLGAQLQAENIDAQLQLRTGENIAGDVAEMFRGHGIPVQARYVGNGDVEVVGEFDDGAEIEQLVRSRAVADVRGVSRILPRTPAGSIARPTAEPAPAPAHIVSIVRGKDPHLVDSEGRRFAPGDDVPGKGQLISIGEFAHVMSPAGELVKVVPGPPPAEDAAAADTAGADGADPRFGAVVAGASAGTSISTGAAPAPSGK